MNGHLNDKDISIYVEAFIQDRQINLPEHLLKHLEDCDECKSNIIDVFIFLKDPDASSSHISDYLGDYHPEKPKKNWRTSFGRIAALFFIFALLASFYFFFLKPEQGVKPKDGSNFRRKAETVIKEKIRLPEQKKTSSDSASVKTNGKTRIEKTQKKNGLSSFEINPNLEYMINSKSRSFSVRILSPENDSIFNERIHFSWKDTENGILRIKILNNKNFVLYDYPVQGNSFLFTEKLDPGLYYWKLESEKDLIHVGKFFIKKPKSLKE